MNGATAVRAVAVLDFAVTLPMAIPVLGACWAALLLSGFGVLQAPGELLPLPLSTLLFLHLAGVLGALWNGARAWRPLPWLVRMDAIGRVAVAALLLWLLLALDAPVVLWLFVATELGGSAIALLALRHQPERFPVA